MYMLTLFVIVYILLKTLGYARTLIICYFCISLYNGLMSEVIFGVVITPMMCMERSRKRYVVFWNILTQTFKYDYR